MRHTSMITALTAVLMASCATDEAPVAEVEEDTIIIATGSRVDGARPDSPAAVAGFSSDIASESATGDLRRAAPSGSSAKSLPGKPQPPAKDRGPQPEPQSGLLTAGDYDDVLNPDLYKRYVDKSLQGPLSGKDLPYVDAADRIVLTVRDRLGKPAPRARLTLKTADGAAMFPLTTNAAGVAYIYPKFDALAPGVTVSVDRAADNQTQTLTTDLLENGGALTFTLRKDAKPLRKLDLLLTIDATGSMGDEMAYLQKELVAILDRVKDGNPDLDIRAGMVAYRDKGDQYVVREFPFTDDLASFKDFLGEQSANGGGDFPEAMNAAMEAGLKFDWRKDAAGINLLVADAPPHDEDITATWESALLARTRGVHIVPISGSGIDKTAEFLMRAMTQVTAGRYIFLTDDSGVGGAHKEAEVDCYVVTRLDGLVQRVIESLVTGQRVEPDGDDVIRTVGAYRQGVCEATEKTAKKKQE